MELGKLGQSLAARTKTLSGNHTPILGGTPYTAADLAHNYQMANSKTQIAPATTYSHLHRGLQAITTGIQRSGTGALQGLSGLADLATPGKGHSRVTNYANKTAKGLDQTVKNERLNTALYKGGQLTGEVAQLAGGGDIAKGIGELGKGTEIAGRVGKLTEAVKGTRLAEALGRVSESSKLVGGAGKALEYVTNPARLANIGGNVAIDQGQRSGKDQKVNLKTVAGSTAANYALEGVVQGASKLGSTLSKKVFNKGSKVAEDARLPRADVPNFSGATDQVTSHKIADLSKQALTTPTVAGTKRVFQAVGKDSKSDYVFDNVDSLRAYKNNTTDPSERFTFKDVPKESLTAVPSKGEHVFQVNADAESPELKLSAATERTPYTPEVADRLSKVNLATPTTGKGVGSEIKNLFTPGGGAEGKKIANDLRATTGATALAKNQEVIAAKPDVNFFKNMSTGDHLNFIQKVESGEKQATPELQNMADKLRTAQEEDFKVAQELKPNITKVDNYFPRAGFWDSSAKDVDSFVKKFQTNTLGGKPTSLESRSFPTIYDGIKAGLTPKESNPAIIALNSRAQLLKAKAAQDFYDQQVKLGRDPNLVKEYIDRTVGKGLENSATYQTAKQAGYAVNNLQLALSGFHVAGTGINAVVSQFANGIEDLAHGHLGKAGVDVAKAPFAPLDYLFKGNKIVKDYKAGNITSDIKNIAEGGGRIGTQVDYRATGLAKSIEQIKSGSAKEVIKGVAAAPLRAISSASKPVMEWWVPRIKAGATKELIDRKLGELGPNASQDAIRAAKSDAIDSVDNRFGQLVKDNLLWKKSIKDISSVLTRSPGWNIGTVREVGGGITDLAKTAAGRGLSERSAYTASLAATTALMGTAISYMFTGQPPKDPIDYFYPKTGKIDKNGNEERVSLPTYAKDIFSFAHNPGQTVANKASPLISIAGELGKNRDYYGNMIRNPDDSKGSQLKQVGGYLEKSLLPFSVTGSNQRVDQGTGTKVQSFFGLNPAPGYITKSPFEQKVSDALNQALGSKALTPEDAAKVNAKSDAKQPNPSPANTSLAKAFTYLQKVDKDKAAQLYKSASPADRAKLQGVSQSSLQKAIDDATLRKRGINPKTGRPIQHRIKK